MDIQNSSIIISSVLKLMSLLGLERGKVERDLIFRSQLLVTLEQYLEYTYGALMA